MFYARSAFPQLLFFFKTSVISYSGIAAVA